MNQFQTMPLMVWLFVIALNKLDLSISFFRWISLAYRNTNLTKLCTIKAILPRLMVFPSINDMAVIHYSDRITLVFGNLSSHFNPAVWRIE